MKYTADSISFYYNRWRKEGIGYISKESIRNGFDLVNAIKILIPKAWGNGNPKTDCLHPFIAEKESVCTKTYLVVGPFESTVEVQNALTYMQIRFLLNGVHFKNHTKYNIDASILHTLILLYAFSTCNLFKCFIFFVLFDSFATIHILKEFCLYSNET